MIDLAVEPGDPDRPRLRGPELVVRLELIHGLEQSELDAVLARLAKRWAADDRIAVLVDSLTVKLVRPRTDPECIAPEVLRRYAPEVAIVADAPSRRMLRGCSSPSSLRMRSVGA